LIPLKLKISRSHWWLLLVLLCGWNIALANGNDNSDQRKLDALKKEILQLKKKLNQFEGKRSGLVKSLQQVEISMASIETDIRQNREQISKSKNQLNQLNQQRKELVKKQKDQKKLIAEQISAHYKMGQEPYIKLLLSEEDPNKVSRLSRYYEYFNRARIQQIELYQADIVALQELETKIEAEQNLLSKKQQQLTQQHLSLAEQSKQRKTLLSKLNSQIKSGNKRLGTLDADQKRLETLLNTLAKTTADLAAAGLSKPFPKARGTLPWPTTGRITRRFGSIQKPSNLRWKGVTLASKEGSHVRSIYHGRVIFSGWLRGHGLILVVEHNKHYLSIYAHNQTLLKEVGDWVTAGEWIATVGMSGGQEKPALYFEIRKDGNPLNPELWCSSDRRS
jgi:septal ring factor EnvC (AmiA/AmiB activator)